MSVCAGLVGLPNVGKSTLFNALTNSSAPAENYPFCTIDPNIACTSVPDQRMHNLQKIYQSEKQLPATVQIVDIAGLVKGAASGAGLGNQFLGHIREVDLILHVLRCFEDSSVTHTADIVDPITDFEIIMQELMLKDLESLEKRIEKLGTLIKKHKHMPKELKMYEQEQELVISLQAALNASNADHVRSIVAEHAYTEIPLLSAKNFLIIANVSEQEMEHEGYKKNKHVQALIARFGKKVIPIAARLEAELGQLDQDEAQEMMNMLGIKERGLDAIIANSYHELGLITFFTCGPKEIHAWPIKKGISIRSAAGEIHSDLERGFIAAEIFNYQDLAHYGTTSKLRDAGKIRTEGQDYIVQDGDIVLIRFNT